MCVCAVIKLARLGTSTLAIGDKYNEVKVMGIAKQNTHKFKCCDLVVRRELVLIQLSSELKNKMII